jgi:hypothetical protein
MLADVTGMGQLTLRTIMPIGRDRPSHAFIAKAVLLIALLLFAPDQARAQAKVDSCDMVIKLFRDVYIHGADEAEARLTECRDGDYCKTDWGCNIARAWQSRYEDGLRYLSQNAERCSQADPQVTAAATIRIKKVNEISKRALKQCPSELDVVIKKLVNPSASTTLSMIPACDAAVSRSQTGNPTGAVNLKHIDDVLLGLQTVNSQFDFAIQKFIRACRNLHGDLTQSGPKMDAMIDSANSLDGWRSSAKVISNAISDRNSDGNVAEMIEKTTGLVVRELRQPACMSSINQKTTELLMQAQTLISQSDIDCSNPP